MSFIANARPVGVVDFFALGGCFCLLATVFLADEDEVEDEDEDGRAVFTGEVGVNEDEEESVNCATLSQPSGLFLFECGVFSGGIFNFLSLWTTGEFSR